MWQGWFKPFGEDSFQKRLAKYLLKQTIGRFLSDDVNWDNYDFQLVNGQVTLRNLHLETTTINKAIGDVLSVQMVSGHIGTLRVVVPWNGFFSEACSMEIEDMSIDLAQVDSQSEPKQSTDSHIYEQEQQHLNTQSPPILSSSFHFADNFIRTELGDDDDSPTRLPDQNESEGNGLSDLAKIIENILSKVTLSLNRISIKVTSKLNASIELKCGQISLCDHTVDTIQRLIPEWLWFNQVEMPVNTIKYLRILDISVGLIAQNSHSTIPLLAIPNGWVRILFKQDSTGYTDVSSSVISATSAAWLSSFDISCDIERIIVVLHPTHIEDILSISSSLLSKSDYIHQSSDHQSCSPIQNSPADSALSSLDPFLLTLHIGRVFSCIFHPTERHPRQNDFDVLCLNDQDVSAQLIGINHLRVDLHTIHIQLQHHYSSLGQAFGIDLVIRLLLVNHALQKLGDKMTTILDIFPAADVPLQKGMHNFVLEKTELPRLEIGSLQPSQEYVRVRIESFGNRTLSKAHPSMENQQKSAVWSHHVTVVLPPLILSIAADVLEDIQVYASSFNFKSKPFSFSTQDSDPSDSTLDAEKIEFLFSMACPFVRIAVGICKRKMSRYDSVYPVVDAFDIQFGNFQQEASPVLQHSDGINAGLVVVGLATTTNYSKYRPIALLENLYLDLSSKKDSPLRYSARFDEIVSDLHKLYRENTQSSDEVSVKSWSDVGSDHISFDNANSVKHGNDSRTKHRHDHPLAALTMSVVIVTCQNVDVHIMDSEFLYVHRLLEQIQALSSSDQGIASYPSFALLFMATKGSLKLTACLELVTSQRFDLNFSNMDMVVSLNSASSKKNSVAVEFSAGRIEFAVQKFSPGTLLHEKTTVFNQTCHDESSPMMRVVFSQFDDFELGLRQTSITTIFNNFTLHLPFDYSELSRIATRNLDQLSDQPQTPGPELDAFVNVHVLLSNYNVIFMTEPFCGAMLLNGGKLRISTNLIAESPTTSYDVSFFNTLLSLSHNPNSGAILSQSLSNEQIQPMGSWLAYLRFVNSVGFVRIGQADIIRALIRINEPPILPNLEIIITPNQLTIDTFPDSFNAVIRLVESLFPKESSSEVKSSSFPDPVPSAESTQTLAYQTNVSDENVFCLVDENAFQFAQPVPSFEDKDLDESDHDWLMGFDHDLATHKKPEVITGTVRGYVCPEEFTIDQNYLARLCAEAVQEKQPVVPPQSVFVLKHCNVIWRLYEGSHWNYDDESFKHFTDPTRKESQTYRGDRADQQENEASIPSSRGSNEKHAAFKDKSEAGDSSILEDFESDIHSTQTSFKKQTKDCELELRLVHIGVDVKMFPEDSTQTTLDVQFNVRDVEIIDHVKSSQWRKFFSYMQPESNTLPRETGSDMITVSWSSIPQTMGKPEIRMRAALLPFRMYIDQDTLNFIVKHTTEITEIRQIQSNPPMPTLQKTPSDNIFFQFCEIEPVMMKIDYKPKHVDFSSLKNGSLIEFLNFVHLDSAELSLHRIRLAGVRGWDNLGKRIMNIWIPHIRTTQVSNMASGVSTVRPFVNIGAGVADLVLLPVEQFKKDGRIVKGLQKGAGAFLKAATMETIRLGSRVAAGTQVILERAEEFMSKTDSNSNYSNVDGGSSSRGSIRGGAGTSISGGGISGSDYNNDRGRQQLSKFSDQPRDIREGLQMGLASLSEGVRSAARTIFAVPTDIYESTDEGQVHPVVRAVPVAILQPMIGATDAVSKTLVGLGNTLDKTQQRRMEDKYKRHG
ncbi:hypothetical protein QVD99_000397 [Batrachochytrium dendrobatidis]|nr:hypothetical protein O5D80_007972 [Batrachochytrium dendrobatidis]KAK5672914.1 hypothetical protein QVD99_000397 [Batrachochytrium dendrobatidis]